MEEEKKRQTLCSCGKAATIEFCDECYKDILRKKQSASPSFSSISSSSSTSSTSKSQLPKFIKRLSKPFLEPQLKTATTTIPLPSPGESVFSPTVSNFYSK